MKYSIWKLVAQMHFVNFASYLDNDILLNILQIDFILYIKTSGFNIHLGRGLFARRQFWTLYA